MITTIEENRCQLNNTSSKFIELLEFILEITTRPLVTNQNLYFLMWKYLFECLFYTVPSIPSSIIELKKNYEVFTEAVHKRRKSFYQSSRNLWWNQWQIFIGICLVYRYFKQNILLYFWWTLQKFSFTIIPWPFSIFYI